MKKMLLHVCCGPCLCGFGLYAEKNGPFDLKLIFYNPNIHPFIEFRRRKKAVKTLQSRKGYDIEMEEGYLLDIFLDKVRSREDRCYACYAMRLDYSAARAKALGIEYLSTTLLVSPHQKHNTIKDLCLDIAQRHSLKFYYYDGRDFYDEGIRAAKAMSLYVQQYCGCIYSEYERFEDTNIHVYNGENN